MCAHCGIMSEYKRSRTTWRTLDSRSADTCRHRQTEVTGLDCLQSKCATNCAMAPDHAVCTISTGDIAECSLRNGTYQMARDIPCNRDSNPITERSGLKPRRPRTSMASVAPFQLRRWTRRDLVMRLSRAGPKKCWPRPIPRAAPADARRYTTATGRTIRRIAPERSMRPQRQAQLPTMSSRSGAILRKIASNRYCRGDGFDDLHLGRLLCIRCRRQRDCGQDNCPAAGGCRLPPAWPTGPALPADEVRNAYGLAIL